MTQSNNDFKDTELGAGVPELKLSNMAEDNNSRFEVAAQSQTQTLSDEHPVLLVFERSLAWARSRPLFVTRFRLTVYIFFFFFRYY
jgi:hypothetical protein